MTTTTHPIQNPVTTGEVSALLLDVRQIASLLNCSQRHCYRLADGGRMPAPLKLGSLVRWPRKQMEDWIAAGCPSCRKGVAR